MSDQVKKLAPAIWAEIQKANKILLHCHASPDPDSVGSALAMKLVLEKMGKKATLISGDDPPLQTLSYLKGFDEILVQDFSQINLHDFDLFIALDTGPITHITRKIELKFPLPIPTLVIDHHKTNDGYGDMSLIEPMISSTAEIVFELISQKDEKLLDKDIASAIYAGIYSDTGGFRFPATTSRSYEIAAKLLDLGIDFPKIVFSVISLPADSLRLLGLGLSTLTKYFGGKVIVTALPHSKLVENGYNPDLIGDVYAFIAYQLSSCNDCSIAVILSERTPGTISVSFRSNNPADFRDVSIIAKEFGGGGHKPASAARFNNSNVEEVTKKILETIPMIYPDLCQP